MSNKYWNGTEHAVLKKTDVQAGWINTPYGSKGLKATNKAFCIWYHGRKTTNDAFSALMTRSLEDCGKTGWGMGVNDLEEAFAHLIKNNGKWTDNTSSSFMYNGKVGGGMIDSSSIPPSITEFLTAVDKMLPKLEAAMKTYQTECAQLQSIKLLPSSPKSDWEKMNKNLGKIKSAAEKVSNYAWLAPPVLTANVPNTSAGWKTINSVQDATEKLTKRMDQTVKFLGAVGKITDGLTMYVQATQAFQGDKRMGVAFAGLSLALTYVPVLGGFYGEIVKQIPGMAINWRNFITDYTEKSLHPEVYLQMEANKPPPWICATCGSM